MQYDTAMSCTDVNQWFVEILTANISSWQLGWFIQRNMNISRRFQINPFRSWWNISHKKKAPQEEYFSSVEAQWLVPGLGQHGLNRGPQLISPVDPLLALQRCYRDGRIWADLIKEVPQIHLKWWITKNWMIYHWFTRSHQLYVTNKMRSIAFFYIYFYISNSF